MCCICEWKQLTAARAGSELLGAGTVQRLNVQRQASALTVQFSQFYIFPPLSQFFNLWFHWIITTRTPKTILKVIFLSFSLQFSIFSRGNWKLQQLRREGNELPGARPHFSRFTCFLFSFPSFFSDFVCHWNLNTAAADLMGHWLWSPPTQLVAHSYKAW